MTMGFCMVQKTSILTPLKLSFSLVFFPSVTAQSPVDAAGSTTLTRNRPRHVGLCKCLTVYPHMIVAVLEA